MMMIDQCAAHERIRYEKYLKNLNSGNGASQQTLFPQSISLNPGDVSLVKEMHEAITSLGFMIEEFGKNDFLIKGIPADISNGDEKSIFEGVLEQFKYNASLQTLPVHENLARSLAKRSALKEGMQLIEEEMRDLVEQLFTCENPNYAPDGRKTFVLLSTNTINEYFNG
jgi:DNA mismatch repair protein MutL